MWKLPFCTSKSRVYRNSLRITEIDEFGYLVEQMTFKCSQTIDWNLALDVRLIKIESIIAFLVRLLYGSW